LIYFTATLDLPELVSLMQVSQEDRLPLFSTRTVMSFGNSFED